MNGIWCPYAGQLDERQNTTEEHIISLSCSGDRNFTVRIEWQFLVLTREQLNFLLKICLLIVL